MKISMIYCLYIRSHYYLYDIQAQIGYYCTLITNQNISNFLRLTCLDCSLFIEFSLAFKLLRICFSFFNFWLRISLSPEFLFRFNDSSNFSICFSFLLISSNVLISATFNALPSDLTSVGLFDEPLFEDCLCSEKVSLLRFTDEEDFSFLSSFLTNFELIKSKNDFSLLARDFSLSNFLRFLSSSFFLALSSTFSAEKIELLLVISALLPNFSFIPIQ